MKTELIFKIEKEPVGYGQQFSPNCKIHISRDKGILYLDYQRRHPVGSFQNLRTNGDLVLADIEIFQNFKDIEYRFEYAIDGAIVKKNEKNECEEVEIHSITALMPFKN